MYPLRPHALVLAVAAAVLMPVSSVYSAPASVGQTVHFDLPADSLANTLNAIARRSGGVVMLEPALVRGKAAPAVRGDMTAEQAMQAALRGSGLVVRVTAVGSFTVQPAGPAGSVELGATTIQGQGLGATTEHTGAYTTGSTSTATKLALSLRETPQSVTVIPRQVMIDQHLQSLDDVVKFTPGLSSNHRDSDRYTFYSRGFQIQNFQYDGIPAQVANESQQYTSTLLDMAMYDRVEVVRGATGLLSGAGTPSATLNLVRKRPTSQFQSYVYGEAGAWDHYRSEADVAGPLTDSGNVRGRLVGVYEKGNSFVDWYKTDKRVMYGALDLDLSEDTLLRLSLDYQNNNTNGASFGHIPLFNNNGTSTDFSRSFNPGARWSFMDNSHYNFTSLVEHKLANDWSLKAAYSHQYAYRNATTGSASAGTPDPATGSGVSMYVNRLDSHQTQDTADVFASGPFTLGGREHELVVGGNVAYTHLNYPTYQRATPAVADIYQWDGDIGGKPTLARIEDNITRLSQTGLYTTVRLKPIDSLSVILGTRVSWWKQVDDTDELPSGENSYHERTQKSGVVTPYAGVVLDLDDNWSVYASYTNIFLPQTYYKTVSNTSLKPLQGDNYEIGLKGAFYEGALNTSLALFEVKQKNTPEQIPTDDGTEAYRAIAGTTTRGIETEISGEVATGWNVIGGYTYRESHDADHNRVETNQPMNQFKLGTTYRLPGEWNRLTVGGNWTWQSDIYAVSGTFATKAHQGDYAVVGLLASYEVDRHLTVGVNLNNLFDKKYYDGLGTFASGSYGEPRNAIVNARWTF